MPDLRTSDFATFFEAVHTTDPERPFRPFPWQIRLVEEVARSGDWPSLLDLPTGTGKTAVLDAAVFLLALEADRGEAREAPLRTIFVVDRRLIVDQALERAKRIQAALVAAPEGSILAEVRARLASINHEGIPLTTVGLRGGIRRDASWARSPDQPLIVVSTVDQVGSRLLFRGYGVSRGMSPVHAGLLGTDTLWLLDEVHLSEAFRQTLTAVSHRWGTWAEQPMKRRFQVVEMSATAGRASDTDAFRLRPKDRQHKVLKHRLGASKKVTIHTDVGKASFYKRCRDILEPAAKHPGAVVAAVMNRVATARELAAHLEKSWGDAREVILLTGRMRTWERSLLEESHLSRCLSSRERRNEGRPLVVVATQCIEAGADFDFDFLLSECASLDALRQRFGRLNRMGDLEDSGGAIVIRSGKLGGDPVYGDALDSTASWLQASGPTIDFGIDALAVPDDPNLLAPRVDAPVLLPAHLDAWVQTSPIPEPEPEVALWLHGPRPVEIDVQVAWRIELDEGRLDDWESLQESLITNLSALPPVPEECVAVPASTVRRWLSGFEDDDIADVEGASVGERDPAERRSRIHRRALVWRGEDSKVFDPTVRSGALRPGDILIVPTEYGGLRNGTWNPAASEPVEDIAEVASFRRTGRAVARLLPQLLKRQDVDPIELPLPSEEEDRGPELGEWIREFDWSGRGPGSPFWEVMDTLSEALDHTASTVDFLPMASGTGGQAYWVAVGPLPKADRTRPDDPTTTYGDRGSFVGREVTLRAHLKGVADLTRDIAIRVGLPTSLAEDLSSAAQYHDLGKTDPRFQRMLHQGSAFRAEVAREPIAKSRLVVHDRHRREAARVKARYPGGMRHEVLSLAMLQGAPAPVRSDAKDWDLVQYLVSSHHGYCRPLPPVVQDPDPVQVEYTQDGVTWSGTTDHGLERLDSEVGDRFWRLVRRYGWWGLTYLETVLRLADHRRSEVESRLDRG